MFSYNCKTLYIFYNNVCKQLPVKQVSCFTFSIEPWRIYGCFIFALSFDLFDSKNKILVLELHLPLLFWLF